MTTFLIFFFRKFRASVPDSVAAADYTLTLYIDRAHALELNIDRAHELNLRIDRAVELELAK